MAYSVLLWNISVRFCRIFPIDFCPNACSAGDLRLALDLHNPVDLVGEALELPLVGDDDDLGVRNLVEYLAHLPELLIADAVRGLVEHQRARTRLGPTLHHLAQ